MAIYHIISLKGIPLLIYAGIIYLTIQTEWLLLLSL